MASWLDFSDLGNEAERFGQLLYEGAEEFDDPTSSPDCNSYIVATEAKYIHTPTRDTWPL